MFYTLHINKFYITLIVLLIFSATTYGVESTAQEQVRLQAVADAQRDAQLAVGKTTWQATGCVAGPFGIGIALIYEPRIPTDRLIGKSPEYVEYYGNEFRRETKGLQVYHSATGCAAFSTGFFLWFILG